MSPSVLVEHDGDRVCSTWATGTLTWDAGLEDDELSTIGRDVRVAPLSSGVDVLVLP